MANIKSARKRIRTNERKRNFNVMYRSQVKTLVRRAEHTLRTNQPSEAAIQEAITVLDKAATKGVLHPNNAARRKSRLMKKFNQVQAQASQ